MSAVDETGSLLDPANSTPTGDRGFHTLPEGAMQPPPLLYQSGNDATLNDDHLIDPDTTHVQYASYPPDEKAKPWNNGTQDHLKAPAGNRPYVPLPLRTWFWVPFVLFLVSAAVILEVLLHFTNKRNGWNTNGNISNQFSALHYAYTLPPVIIAMTLGALWAWTDVEIKKMQPYVDLSHGDSPPHKSLLLDYTRTNNFLVWTYAAYNKHYLVALATLMVLLSLCLQPLAAALIAIRNTWTTEPDMIVNNLGALGLNQNEQFQDLTSFLSAAGFASASVLFNLGDPPFVHGPYTIPPFEIPRSVASNGTVFANTTAVKSDSGCVAVTPTMVNHTDGSGWTNNASLGNCSLTWEVDHNASSLFGTSVPTCTNPPPDQFAPVVFWFFTYVPQALSSATFCSPTISFFNVHVGVDLGSGNLTSVTELGPFTSSSNFSSLSGNVTGPPLNGRAYNGIGFNLTSNPDRFVLARLNATQLQMPAAVFQSALQSPQGLAGSFSSDSFVQLSTQVYTTYLKLIAKSVYFLPFQEPMTVVVKTFTQRLFLSDTAVHLLAVAMLLLAIFGTILQIFHRQDRKNLPLRHVPGTIAAAVSIGGSTSMGELLAGRHQEDEISEALRNKKFRIDPVTMKIVMQGEEGYEYAASPSNRRQSIFSKLQSRKAPRTPTTPRQPSPA